MKTFAQFSAARHNRFSWAWGDLQHHGVIRESHDDWPSDPRMDEFWRGSDGHTAFRTVERGSPEFGHIDTYRAHHMHINMLLRGAHLPHGGDEYFPNYRKPRSPGEEWRDDEYRAHAKTLSTLTNHPSTRPAVLFRGFDGKDIDRFKPGHEFTDHGFTATSSSPRAIKDSEFGHATWFRIHAPKGTLGRHVPETRTYSPHDDSASIRLHNTEVLLHRGTRFRVADNWKEDPRIGGCQVVDLHVIGNEHK